METQLLNSTQTKDAAEILKNGGLVAIPTETVYGLAANALNEKAVENIFLAKGRAQDNPLIVHISDIEDIAPLVEEFPQKARILAEKFWPGPLTMIMKKTSAVPDVVTCGMPTVAIRMPSHPVAREIIEKSGLPIAAPSANLSGGVSPTTAGHCIADLSGRVDAILDGGECEVGLESTVILMASEPPRLLRPGYITAEQIEEVIGEIEIDKAITNPLKEGERPLSPGMKYKHYSPNAKVVIVEGNGESYAQYVNSKSEEGVFALCFEEDAERLQIPYVVFGKETDSATQAQGLFDSLRKLDLMGAQRIYARCPSSDGVGLAVYNRLLRAAGFEVVKADASAFVIGLTGPSGSGKSTVAKLLSFPVIDADKIAREVMQKGQECLLKCADAFGQDIINKDGTLNRSLLASRAFESREKTELLNHITHPYICAKIEDEIKNTKSEFIILDAPQLFESGCDDLCDYILGVIADPSLRKERIMARDNLSEDFALTRMKAGLPQEFFEQKCNKIVYNNGDINSLEKSVQNIKEELLNLEKNT